MRATGWTAALVGGGVLNTALKATYQRVRPSAGWSNPFVTEPGWSFPSGHAMGSLVAYGMLAYLLITHEHTGSPGRRLGIVAAALGTVLLIGFSRIYLTVHYFSDVAGGYAAGGAWLVVCVTGVEAARRHRNRRARTATEAAALVTGTHTRIGGRGPKANQVGFQLMNVLLYAVAVLVGMLFPVQAGLNSTLGKGVQNPSFAALISGVGTAVVLLVYVAFARTGLPSGETIGRAPWWSWGGGVPGSMIVLAATLLAPRLGSAPFQALVIGGQLAVSIALDHFGALGFPEHPAGVWRFVGLAFMLVGVFLIAKF